MARVKRGSRGTRSRKKIVKAAEGYWGRRKNLRITAKEAVQHALIYAYRDRRNRKRDMRRLWILRINAALRQNGMTYSKFMGLMRKAKIEIDRKQLAEMAINDPPAFKNLIESVQKTAVS